MQTRWRLQRHPAHPKLIRLLVQEIGPMDRGCSVAVTCRRGALEMLPVLRDALEERIRRADAPQGRTFDPVDADGQRCASGSRTDS